MGLAGVKKRTKIGHDPNNTTWTSATSRYGHRLLTSAGWTPGTTLGAKNAAHSAHYTAGSESHIRIAPCVEGKGLGARKTTDETFGLRVLSGLLGRLNGKDTTAIEEQLDRRRGEGYIEQRGWGLHFVFGGYLVGDKIEKDKKLAVEVGSQRGTSKKRKHESDGHEDLNDKARKRAEKTARRASKHDITVAESSAVLNDSGDSADTADPQRLRREAKLQRREARRLKREKKELRNRKKSASEDSVSKTPSQPLQEKKLPNTLGTPIDSPATSGATTPMFMGGRGRHAMRQKYIDQKRMACMDDKALNEIFMIKPVG